MFWRTMSACRARLSLAASMAAAAAVALVTGSPEAPTDKGKHPKAAGGVAPDVPEHRDYFWGQPCPLTVPGAARRPRPRSRCMSCRALRRSCAKRRLPRCRPPAWRTRAARTGWCRGRRRTRRAAAVLVGAVCVQLARRAGVPHAPARRPPLCLPRIARRDRLSPAVLGRPRAASRRGVGAAVVPVARGEPLVVAVQGGPVGLEHPDPLVALVQLRGAPCALRGPVGIEHPDPLVALVQLRGAPCLEHPDPLVALRARPSRLGLQRREPAAIAASSLSFPSM